MTIGDPPPDEPGPEISPDASPRRVYPRDDSLGGGAPRNFPVSKAGQNSNRVGGEYW